MTYSDHDRHHHDSMTAMCDDWLGRYGRYSLGLMKAAIAYTNTPGQGYILLTNLEQSVPPQSTDTSTEQSKIVIQVKTERRKQDDDRQNRERRNSSIVYNS
jgi:hypothetical protein